MGRKGRSRLRPIKSPDSPINQKTRKLVRRQIAIIKRQFKMAQSQLLPTKFDPKRIEKSKRPIATNKRQMTIATQITIPINKQENQIQNHQKQLKLLILLKNLNLI